eukprot:5151832-Pyramimonas_sp.AAC.1
MLRRACKRRLDPPDQDAESSESGIGTDCSGDSDNGREAHERSTTSSLSSLLLRDWAWGRLYGTEVHRYCLAAHRAGMRHVAEISEIAAMGSWGERPQNIHRDLTK